MSLDCTGLLTWQLKLNTESLNLKNCFYTKAFVLIGGDSESREIASKSVYLKRLSAVEVNILPVPKVSLVAVPHPQHVAFPRGHGPEVNCQAEHVRAEHVVVEAEDAALGRCGRILAALVCGLKDSAQQNGRVLELLRSGGLDVEVMAREGAQRVVPPGARVEGRSGSADAGPVKGVRSADFLPPVAQSILKVTLHLWSCQTQSRWMA